ncbi:putative membrane protein [Sporolactobacillus spathodeae]|uniref:Membrane protein n=1 Tax=Sporolactobacillus spathodeae TaxID=1465502 RepID=A0ABS2Q6Y2_9BACL|nr:putative membrane protein [Sporolactobacillus spathodeae]
MFDRLKFMLDSNNKYVFMFAILPILFAVLVFFFKNKINLKTNKVLLLSLIAIILITDIVTAGILIY